MRREGGQAARAGAALLRWTANAALLLGMLGLTGLIALEWRLSRGPMRVPWLAGVIEAAANHDDGTLKLRIGAASLASAAWRDGPDAPLVLSVADARAEDGDGARVFAAPSASVALALPPLLAGEIRPRAIEATGIRLRLHRAADGGLGLDLAKNPRAGKAPSDGAPDPAAIFRQIRRVALRDSRITVADEMLGTTWQLSSGGFAFARCAKGGIDGTGDVALALGGQAATAIIVARADPVTEATHARLRLEPVTPRAWAMAAPQLAPLAALDAPVSADITGDLGPDLWVRHVHAEANAASGTARINGAGVALLGASVVADGTPDRMALNLARIVVRGRPESSPTTIALRGTLAREAPGLEFTAGLDLDQAAFADLPLLWPEEVGRNARRWVTRNITGGVARAAHVDFVVTAPADFSDVQLTSAAGGLQGDDLTVHWLRPVPPIEHGTASLRILDPDTLLVVVTGGRQRPSGARASDPRAGLVLRGGTVRITGIEQPHQFGAIVADIDGPLADAVGLFEREAAQAAERAPDPAQEPVRPCRGKAHPDGAARGRGHD